MHEISIMEALYGEVRRIARDHGARRADRIVVEIGDLANVVPELLEQAFVAFREVEPLIAGAALEIRHLPLRLRCRVCGRESERPDRRFVCPGCDSNAVDVTQGEELLLRDVELEV